MIQLFKEQSMETELMPSTSIIGDGTCNSYIIPNPDIWKLCINEMKELNYSLAVNKLGINSFLKNREKLTIVPSTALELKRLGTDTVKTYTDVVYVYTPTPITSDIIFKIEHDYYDLTAKLKLFGSTFTTCVNCSAASEGPWPLAIEITLPASEDIRLFTDISLCCIRIENTVDASILEINDTGEVNLCKFPTITGQTRRVRIYEL